jgi:hypothetical protein
MRKSYSFFYGLLLILFIALFFRPITAINYDLGRHILLGRIIVQEQHVPYINLLSFTYPNYPFAATSWLSEVVYYGITNIAGFNMLLLFSIGIVLAACLVQLKFVLPKYSHASIIAVSFFYLIFLGIRSDIRPEFFSMLFMSLFIFILRSYKKLTFSAGLILILIEVLWVNMHIYFFVGPLLVALFLLDQFIVSKKISVKEMLVLVGVGGATLFNPAGLKGALYPFFVFQNYGFPIFENQSIFTLFQMSKTGVLLSIFTIFFLFISLFLGRKNARPVDWFLAFVFGFLFILNYRNVVLFVFATFITMVSQFSFVIRKYSKKLVSIPHPPSILFYSLGIFLVVIIILNTVFVRGIGFGMIDYGKKSVDFVIQNKIEGLIYNSFDIGGYLTYRLYPRLVFLDNRPEAYPASFFKDIYLPMQNNPEIFKKLDFKYGFNALIISHRDGAASKTNLLFRHLMHDSGYLLVYLDSYAFVMVKNSIINQEIINKYKITQDSLSFSDERNPQKLIYYLSFFEKVGWSNKAKETFFQLKKVDPMLCELRNFPFLHQAKIDYISESDFQNCKIL